MDQHTDVIAKAVQGSLSIIEQDREKEIISRRFGLNGERETLEQIGEFLSITRERVRQLEKAIVVRLRIAAEDVAQFSLGSAVDVSLFSEGQRVDVRGRSVGKGFAGTIKRHHFSGQRKTHGNSLSHRVPGSIGQNQTPGRVFKGKKMSGHLGNKMRSTQNLEIARVDGERNLLLIKGAVPGAKGGFVVIRPSVKA